MTLKNALASPGTPLRGLIAEHLPLLGKVLRQDLNAQMAGVSAPVIPQPSGAPRGLLGHAIEQRIVFERADPFDFDLAEPRDGAIRAFAYTFGELYPIMRNRALFDELRLRLTSPAMGGYPGDEPILGADPDRAARLAITLGMLDQSYRSPVPPDLLLTMAGECDNLDEALALIDPVWVDDVNAVADLALPLLPGGPDSTVLVAPKLSGGDLVGGADADLLIDRTLIDVKTVAKGTLDLATLLRTFCYALFDLRNEHRIEHVAVLFARHGRLVTWNVADILDRAGGLTVKDAQQRVIRPL